MLRAALHEPCGTPAAGGGQELHGPWLSPALPNQTTAPVSPTESSMVQPGLRAAEGGVQPPHATAQKLGRYGQFVTVGTKTPRNVFLLSLDANHFPHPFRRTMWNNSVST